MKIYAISDLHGHLPKIPPCDILLLGGDYCASRNIRTQIGVMLGYFTDWLKELEVKHIIAVGGNHDFALEQERNLLEKDLPWTYLQDEAITVEGITIYGTPWTSPFLNWAFMKDERVLKQIFNNIPEHVDILLSHGPAYGILDTNINGTHCGSKALLTAIEEKKPNTVIHGHIHEARGVQDVGKTRYHNVTYLDHRYGPIYGPMEIRLEK